MNVAPEPALLQRLRAALLDLDPRETPGDWLRALVQRGFGQLPLPRTGRTFERWQALAAVAGHDLSLAKLYEGHTDALSIKARLGRVDTESPDTWGTCSAEAPDGRTIIELRGGGHVQVRGAKCWCSGAAHVDHGLLTGWFADGRGPQLVTVAMSQPGIAVGASAWQAVGMAGSSSVDVVFIGTGGELVGHVGDYLSRPGFWQGGAGIAACWYGGATALGEALRHSLEKAPQAARSAFRLAALGKIDMSLRATAGVLRDAAFWIDQHPPADASSVALRARLAAEACATLVLAEAGRALGAGAFCRDARFARMAADLAVFVRQSHGERDFAALGERVALAHNKSWDL